jgi:hypothetical protein
MPKQFPIFYLSPDDLDDELDFDPDDLDELCDELLLAEEPELIDLEEEERTCGVLAEFDDEDRT